MRQAAITILISMLIGPPALAQSPVPVTVDNFARAESDLYFGNADAGGTGKLFHHREPVANRQAIRDPAEPRHTVMSCWTWTPGLRRSRCLTPASVSCL